MISQHPKIQPKPPLEWALELAHWMTHTIRAVPTIAVKCSAVPAISVSRRESWRNTWEILASTLTKKAVAVADYLAKLKISLAPLSLKIWQTLMLNDKCFTMESRKINLTIWIQAVSTYRPLSKWWRHSKILVQNNYSWKIARRKLKTGMINELL